jgi:hypothetical protein
MENGANDRAVTYFHCAPVGLEPGSIIRPGNWGRILLLYEQTNNSLNINAIREVTFELARLAYAPNKPSRLECIFAVLSLSEAITFRNTYQKTNLIYEVVPVVDQFKTHLGDYVLAVKPHPIRYFQNMLDMARDYWMVSPQANVEILFDCPVRVVAVPPVPPP